MTAERFRKVWLALYGAGMIALGVILLSQGSFIVTTVTSFVGLAVLVGGVNRIIKSLTGRKNIGSFLGIVLIAAGVFAFFFPDMTFGLITILFSIYVFINATVKFVDLFASIKNKTIDVFADMAGFLFFAVFGTIMLFGTFIGPNGMLVVSGIYFVLYGATQLNDFIRNIIPQKAKRAARRKIRVSIPLFIASFVPLGVLKNYQKLIDTREIDLEKLLSEVKETNENVTANIHVLIHVSDDGVGMMGHCDIMINKMVMSYGNYDESSSRLFGGIGDGVMFCSDFETYVKFSVENDNQMIFDYGIYLNDRQMSNVLSEIERIKKNVYEWKPPYCAAKSNDENADIADYPDYCSKLWNGTHAVFYKFRSGKFKSYCVMSTNCVLLADSILSKASTDIVNIAGIISPGTYFDYLETEYNLENGIVITRDIYCKEHIP